MANNFTVFRKEMVCKKEEKKGQKFYNYFGKFNDTEMGLVSVTFSNECKAKLTMAGIKKFPIGLTLEDKDLFIKKEKVTTDKGTYEKYVVVILDFEGTCEAELPEAITSEELIAEMSKEKPLPFEL